MLGGVGCSLVEGFCNGPYFAQASTQSDTLVDWLSDTALVWVNIVFQWKSHREGRHIGKEGELQLPDSQEKSILMMHGVKKQRILVIVIMTTIVIIIVHVSCKYTCKLPIKLRAMEYISSTARWFLTLSATKTLSTRPSAHRCHAVNCSVHTLPA